MGGIGAFPDQIFLQRGGFPPQKHPQVINGRPGRGLENRYRGRGGGDLGLGVGHIQPAHKAGVMALLGDCGGTLLRLQVGTGNDELLLRTPQVEIVGAHVSHQGYQDVAAILHRGLEISPGGLDAAPRATENIHFPVGIETRLPQIPESPDGSDCAAAAGLAGALAPLVKC